MRGVQTKEARWEEEPWSGGKEWAWWHGQWISHCGMSQDRGSALLPLPPAFRHCDQMHRNRPQEPGVSTSSPAHGQVSSCPGRRCCVLLTSYIVL